MAEKELQTTRVKNVPRKDPQIGIDTNNKFQDDVLLAQSTQSLDFSAIENFSTVSQSRETIYQTIDTMSQDSLLASVIETYAEDTVQPNENGKIFWVESDDPACAKLVNFYLEALNVDKNAYDYAIGLIKYGDLYLQLFRESEYEDDVLADELPDKSEKEKLQEAFEANLIDDEKEELTEDVKLKAKEPDEHYALYLEQVPNPGEMFELVRHGETRAFIKAPTQVQGSYSTESTSAYNIMKYKINRGDVTLYNATDFVHAYLSNAISRDPEKVNLFITDEKTKAEKHTEFTVRRGSSLLSDIFKIWRELSLLENSVLLSRLTKSSIIRLYQVEVGDMPTKKVQMTLAKVKELIEQKSAINTGNSLQEYTNPGPIENSIIFPVHEGKGAISQAVVGGDVDPKQLTDLDWFNNKLFGALRIPKQYFGWTSDDAGFSGGQSLSILSSRYGKAVRRIQKALIEAITDVINILLIARKQFSFVNKFKIKMQAPLTQEEIDRRTDDDNRIRYVGDLMSQLNDISDPQAKLKILKSLLSETVTSQEVLAIIQEEIDKLDAVEEEETPADNEEESPEEPMPVLGGSDSSEEPEFGDEISDENPSLETTPEETSAPIEGETASIETGGSYLPNPNELGQDMTQNN